MVFNKQTIRDVKTTGKRVLIRADYNVPLNDQLEISDDYRITQSLPTLRQLIKDRAKLIVMSHLGRPDGQVVDSLSLAPVARRLRQLLPDCQIFFVEDCVGPKVDKAIKALKPAQILLLENTRFHAQDEADDQDFARQLATHAQLFVQDCFGAVHRRHASITGVTNHLPSVAGLLVEKEVTTITKAMSGNKRPLGVVIGGAKIPDKVDVLKQFVTKADFVAVGGAMANVFLKAKGYQVGTSLAPEEDVPLAKEVLEMVESRAQHEPFEFYLPRDCVVSKSQDGKLPTRVVDLASHTLADICAYPKRPSDTAQTVADDEAILDIGPLSAHYIAGVLSQLAMVIWNGTVGMTETEGAKGAANPFEHGTNVIAEVLARDKSPFTIVGGGDTVAYVESVPGLRQSLNHVSTGGGASIQLMSGQTLPGISVLLDRKVSS